MSNLSTVRASHCFVVLTRRIFVCVVMKNGTKAYRSRAGLKPVLHGRTLGELLKEGRYGIGHRSGTPYAFRTLVGHVHALDVAYDTAGVSPEQNPARHPSVDVAKQAIKILCGLTTGIKMPDIITPEMAMIMVSSLDAGNLRHVRLAVLLAQGLTLGERPRCQSLRDFADANLSAEGLVVFKVYDKSDKERVCVVFVAFWRQLLFTRHFDGRLVEFLAFHALRVVRNVAW